VQGDGRYSFEFGKPIKINLREKEPSTSDVKLQEGKITFQKREVIPSMALEGNSTDYGGKGSYHIMAYSDYEKKS
jgi:hypothetical protein